jgi:hypothetical protein
MALVAVLVERDEEVGRSPEDRMSPVPMRTWKMDGPPEIVDGIVMYVMTSWSLRPARRARKPPIV